MYHSTAGMSVLTPVTRERAWEILGVHFEFHNIPMPPIPDVVHTHAQLFAWFRCLISPVNSPGEIYMPMFDQELLTENHSEIFKIYALAKQ